MNTKIQVLRSKNGEIFKNPINGSPGWIWREGDFVEMRYYIMGEEKGWITLDEYLRKKRDRKCIKAQYLKNHPEELRRIIDSKKRSSRGDFHHMTSISA
jgi:hypothetical protein